MCVAATRPSRFILPGMSDDGDVKRYYLLDAAQVGEGPVLILGLILIFAAHGDALRESIDHDCAHVASHVGFGLADRRNDLRATGWIEQIDDLRGHSYR